MRSSSWTEMKRVPSETLGAAFLAARATAKCPMNISKSLLTSSRHLQRRKPGSRTVPHASVGAVHVHGRTSSGEGDPSLSVPRRKERRAGSAPLRENR